MNSSIDCSDKSEDLLLDPSKLDDEKIENNEITNERIPYDWTKPLKLLAKTIEENESLKYCDNFTKGCNWSPDGTCLLVPWEDFRIRIYDLPTILYNNKSDENFERINLKAALTIKEGGLIYDTCWYPFTNSWIPETCCFLSASKESPIHLWDAFNGNLRATYRAYNQVDEVEPGISVQFVNQGSQVWSGHKNRLQIFDTERPGRQTNTIELKKDFPNANGLISCIRENPSIMGLVAFGTYSKCVGLWKDTPLCSFKTASGVTQIEFSTCGRKLYTAVRRNEEFLCWDLRNPGQVLCSFEERKSDTNQRIQFHPLWNENVIISGGTNGRVTVWNQGDSKPKTNIQLSKDCINGVNVHPNLPILACSSGQRINDCETVTRDNSVQLLALNSKHQ